MSVAKLLVAGAGQMGAGIEKSLGRLVKKGRMDAAGKLGRESGAGFFDEGS